MRHRIVDPASAELLRRSALADALEQVLSVDSPARDRVAAFVHDHDDALLRTCAEGHLTGSALVVDVSCDRLLLLHHRKLRKWLQPGGHADGDANLAAVALREATEETGLDGLRVVVPAVHLDIHRVEPPREAPHLHLDVRFLVLAPPGAVAVGNHESLALRWVSEAELPAYTDEPGLLELAGIGLALARRLA
jgi:8-oxo-dGTP pyrophosphatase MutT (NUDIX family)